MNRSVYYILITASLAATTWATTTNRPVIYYTFDQDHSTLAPGGNGISQLIAHTTNSRAPQSGVIVGPISAFDSPQGQTYFFDKLPGGGSPYDDGLPKIGTGALHLRPVNLITGGSQDEGHVKVLGDVETNDPDYIVNSTHSNLFDRTDKQDWTIEFWFRAPDNNDVVRLLSHADGADIPRVTVILMGGASADSQRLRYTVKNQAENFGGDFTVTSERDYQDGKWHHFALVRDANPNGKDDDDYFIGYLDGGAGGGGETFTNVVADVGAGYLRWSEKAPPDEPFDFFIGLDYQSAAGNRTHAGGPFDIDDFAIFDVALSPEELGFSGPAYSAPVAP